ncbi:MAG TPA: ATP-binding protein [Anaerolineales bacterium]
MRNEKVSLSLRVTYLQKVFPLFLISLVIIYQHGLARWVHDHYSHSLHYWVEILFYASVGPVLSFWILGLIRRWLDEKERAQQMARTSERYLASITRASADAIFSLDPMGRIESWNRGAELIFGYEAGEILGRPLSDLFGGTDAAVVELRWLVESVVEAGFVRGHETTCQDAAGHKVIAELTATRLADESGQILGLSIILRDITQRKQREEEIHRLNANLMELVALRTSELAEKVDQLAQANAELKQLDRVRSEFVSLVSHQLRAPLTNIRGAVERIEDSCKMSNGTCMRMLTIIDQQINRLDKLVKDVLNATRIESGDLIIHAEPVSVWPVVAQLVEQMRSRASGRPLRLSEKPGLPLVYADRDRMAEVVMNLLDNADKYSPPGKEILVDLSADDSGVTVSVRDFGAGIPEGDFERVFEKFYRADNSDSQSVYGYGLGLYVCRLLAEAQGGYIWAENHPQGGAIFSLKLPLERQVRLR